MITPTWEAATANETSPWVSWERVATVVQLVPERRSMVTVRPGRAG